jgi:hypothetical protein
MEKLGQVEAILNDDLVLISFEGRLQSGDKVGIYSEIKDPAVEETGLLKSIFYPKGKLEIVCRQENDLYLAKRFRELKTRTRKVLVPARSFRTLTSLLNQLQPETKEITEEIPGAWSAELDEEQSLKLAVPTVVAVGDAIGGIE